MSFSRSLGLCALSVALILGAAGSAPAEISSLPDYARISLGQNTLAVLAPSRCDGIALELGGFAAHTKSLYERLTADGYNADDVQAFLLTEPGLAFAQEGAADILGKHGVEDVHAPGFCAAIRVEAGLSRDFAPLLRMD